MNQTALISNGLEERVEKLERQNRKLRNGLFALLLLVLIGLGYLSKSTREAPVIKTKKIILLDDHQGESSFITSNSITLQNDNEIILLTPKKLRIVQDKATETELSPLGLSLLGAGGAVELSPQGTKMFIKGKE